MRLKYKGWTTTKTMPPKILKCSRSKTIRPRKLKLASCWFYEINMLWTFKLSMPICFGLREFQSFGGLVFCLFPLYSHFMVCGSLSKWYRNIPYNAETSWKKGNCPDNLKIFQTFWKVFTQYGNFQDTLGTFQTVGKVYIKFIRFTDNLETF